MAYTYLVYVKTFRNYAVIGAFFCKISFFNHISNAALSAAFFVGCCGGYKCAFKFYTCFFKGISRHNFGNNSAFLVGRASGINISVFNFTAVRVCCPAFAFGNNIIMSRKVNIGSAFFSCHCTHNTYSGKSLSVWRKLVKSFFGN